MPDSKPSPLSDAALVKQARSGDTEAFGHLYERYAEVIYRFIFAQISDRMEAEDLTTDVFLRAWRFLPRFRERKFPFSAFLYKIARNLLIDRYRKISKRQSWSYLPEDSAQIEPIQPRDFFENTNREFVQSALGQLRGDYRTVLVLRFFNDQSPLEISQIMRRSEGSIRVLQHRALKALSKILIENGISETQ